MMTSLEKKIMRKVIEYSVTKGTPIVSTYADFEHKWNYKDFSPTFARVVKNHLSEKQKFVLHKRYGNGRTLQSIADEVGVSVTRITQYEQSAIERLAGIDCLKELYMGSFAYERMMQEQRIKLQEALEGEKNNYKGLKLNKMNLNARAFNVLVRAVGVNEDKVTAEMCVERIPSLFELKACGIYTMVHIIRHFEDAGIPCEQWQRELDEKTAHSERMLSTAQKARNDEIKHQREFLER